MIHWPKQIRHAYNITSMIQLPQLALPTESNGNYTEVMTLNLPVQNSFTAFCIALSTVRMRVRYTVIKRS